MAVEMIGGPRLCEPLLYPSELRGHGAGTLVHRLELREPLRALSKVLA